MTVAAAMRKSWLETFPSVIAKNIICWSQSVKIVCERGCPFWNKNRAPGVSLLIKGKSLEREMNKADAPKASVNETAL